MKNNLLGKFLLGFFFVTHAAIFFTACGDDGSSTSAKDESSSSEIGKSSSSEAISYSSSENLELAPEEVFGELVDSRDNQVYKTVKIGSQIWMAENLNYAYLQRTVEEDSSSWCYSNSADSCAKYGRLYLWSAAIDSAAKFLKGGKGCGSGVPCHLEESIRGVCPEGWHLPSVEEWHALFLAAGGSAKAGNTLKSKSGWYDDGNGSDEFVFSVLPSGLFQLDSAGYGDDGFYGAGTDARFWTSEQKTYDPHQANFWLFTGDKNSVLNLTAFIDSRAFSVRCVKD